MDNNKTINENLKEAINIIESKYEYRRFTNFEYRSNEGTLLSEEQINEQEWLDNVQTVLDYAGIIPVIGDAIDVINALIYFTRAGVEGKFMPNGLNGLFSVIAVIPVVGSALSIPMKTAFKALPTAKIAKVVETLFRKSGKEAAEEMAKSATTSGSKKALNSLSEYITKNLDSILKGTKALKSVFKALAVIPFTKIDDKLAVAGVALIKKLEDFLKTLGVKNFDAAAKTVSSNLLTLPKNMLTKRGRIAAKSGLLRTPGHKRMFYASQDMFSDYIMKEGSGKITKEYLSSASKSLSERGIKGATQEQLKREVANLMMVNDGKIFKEFMESSTGKQRVERFMKTLTDPSIIRDANSVSSQLRKVGFKGLLSMGKIKPSEDEYGFERDKDKQQNKLDSNKPKKGSHIGKKRNV